MSRSRHTRFAVALFGAALALIAIIPGAAWATKRCPPLVAVNNGVECKVANYSTSPDTNVTITLYGDIGNVLVQCGPWTIEPKGSVFCNYFANTGTDVSCEVTGEGSAARASLVVYAPGNSVNAGAAVECN